MLTQLNTADQIDKAQYQAARVTHKIQAMTHEAVEASAFCETCNLGKARGAMSCTHYQMQAIRASVYALQALAETMPVSFCEHAALSQVNPPTDSPHRPYEGCWYRQSEVIFSYYAAFFTLS